MGEFVYVIRFGDFDHKIGVSNNPDRRLWEVGGERVCRTWSADRFNAYTIESAAHRLLRKWQIPNIPSVERFRASEETACMAVHLAIALLNDERAEREAAERARLERAQECPRQAKAPPEPPKEMFGPPAELAPPMFGPPAPFRVGYVQRASTKVIERDIDRLMAAGVARARIYHDHGLEPGPGFAAAIKACRAGNLLVVTQSKHARPEAIEALARKGAFIVRATA